MKQAALLCQGCLACVLLHVCIHSPAPVCLPPPLPPLSQKRGGGPPFAPSSSRQPRPRRKGYSVRPYRYMDGSTSAKVVDQQHTPGSSGSRSGSGIELSSQVVHERSSLHEEQDEDTTMSRGSEHEPLIGGSNNGSRQRTAQDRTGSGSNNAGQTPQVADRRQVYLAYACFVVLGVSVLFRPSLSLTRGARVEPGPRSTSLAPLERCGC